MKKHFIHLQEYSTWANQIVTSSALSVNAPEKAIQILSHIVNANTLWLDRMTGRNSAVQVWGMIGSSQLEKKMHESDIALLDYIKNSDEDSLNNIINYTNSKGDVFGSKVSEILNQLNMHSAYHRGQVILLMKDVAAALPMTDYIHYQRSVKNS